MGYNKFLFDKLALLKEIAEEEAERFAAVAKARNAAAMGFAARAAAAKAGVAA